MKYLALALALLLTVGSHAAPAMENVPAELVKLRADLDNTLMTVQQSLQDAVNTIGDQDLKDQLSRQIDGAFQQVQLAKLRVEPLTNAVVTTVMESTADMRAGMQDDIESLKITLKPKVDQLRDTLEKHKADYMEAISSHFEQGALDNLRDKLDSIMNSLKLKFNVNVEETKTDLQPIVEEIRAKLVERVVAAKEIAGPYVDEYKEKAFGFVRDTYEKAQSIGTQDLQEKVVPLATEIYAKAQEIRQAVSEAFNKQ